MLLIKFQEKMPNCVYSYYTSEDITDDFVNGTINAFKKFENTKDDLKGLDVLEKKRERRTYGADVKRALCYVDNDCFSIAIYPEQKLIEYTCRKKARVRFEKMLTKMGFVIE